MPPSGEQATETGPSSATTAVTRRGLPPNIVKADTREVKRAFMQLDGRRADVVFTDAHGMKRTLHAYAEHPSACVGGRLSCFGST
jgi:hypothetical protein